MNVDVSVEIARPPEEVFAYLTDPSHLTEWQRATSEVTPQGETTWTQVMNVGGRRIESQVEVVESEPPRRFAIRSSGGPLEFRVEHTLEPAGDGTLLRVHGEGEAKGVLRFAAGMIGPRVEQEMRGDFERLKQLVEAG